MAKDVSPRSTKEEILQAYNELQTRLREQRIQDRKSEKKKEEEEKTVETAALHTDETILKGLAELKLEIVKSVDAIGDQLMNERKKLQDLRRAIEIEQGNLEELYSITANVDSLSVLLASQKERKAEFEAFMEERKLQFDEEIGVKKAQWKIEQETFEQQKKERDASLKKERQREEEEYLYALGLQRKKDTDNYEAMKASIEKELEETRLTVEKDLAEREARMAGKEQEWSRLSAAVEAFPAELDRMKRETAAAVTERLEFLHQHATELALKEMDGERKLNAQIIVSLESKIKEQDELIRQLTQKATDAGLQVQSIAIKAIEGASAQRVYPPAHEKSTESTRS
jgi:hypothetical protein